MALFWQINLQENKKEDNIMKTKNNVQKTALRFTAVILSFILISVTVSAQGLWKELLSSDHFKQIAFSLLENPSKIKNVVPDKELSFTANSFNYKEEVENPMELESWMIDDSNFDSIKIESNIVIIGDKENELTIESWMLDDNIWDI
jgi:hypothetical protein